MTKRTTLVCALLLITLCASTLSAQMKSLTYGTDYTVSDEVYSVTTVKVAPNRIEHYLAGIQQTWVQGVTVAQEMGLNAGHAIYTSMLPESGDYNVTLVVTFENLAQREKGNDPKVAAEFQRKLEAKISEQENFNLTQGYTEIRDIVGEYLVRQVTLE